MNGFKIRRVTIEGFRRIQEKLVLEMVDPKGEPVSTFVIAGPNGCGKTSVLEAILLVFQQEQKIFASVNAPEAGVRDPRQLGTSDKTRIIVEFDHPSSGTLVAELTGTGTVEVRNLAGARRKDIIGIDWSDLVDLPLMYFSSRRTQRLAGPLKPFDDATRASGDERDRLWKLKESIINERARRGFPTSQAAPGFRDEEWLDRISRAWRAFRGQDGTSIDALTDYFIHAHTRADLFVVRDVDHEKICSIDRVSSGELEILTLAGWLILHEFRVGIVLIDEPELHLHPQWQATILPALRGLAPDVQFIVATHADAPWDAATTWERVLLVPESDPRSKTWREAHSLVREEPAE